MMTHEQVMQQIDALYDTFSTMLDNCEKEDDSLKNKFDIIDCNTILIRLERIKQLAALIHARN